MSDAVNHPSYYADGKYEVIDLIEDYKMGFHIGNAVKYISRAGKKDFSKRIQDLEKAIWYLKRALDKNVYEVPGSKKFHTISIVQYCMEKKISNLLESALIHIVFGQIISAIDLINMQINNWKDAEALPSASATQ